MQNLNNHIIHDTVSIVEAMELIGKVPRTLTLFVVDQQNRLVGTLTDGDIRRGFIEGHTLTDPVHKFMFRSFHKINNAFTIHDLKIARDKGIRMLPVLKPSGEIEKIYDLKQQKSILPLECMIMAGGEGQRLRPLTENTPKPMLLLGDKPILEHNIDHLIRFGIEKFYISVKYLGQQVVDYFGDGSSKGVSIEYIWEDQPLGTAGALRLVDNFKTDHILLMNSDLFTNINLEDLYIKVIEKDAKIGVASVPYTTKVPFGIFTTSEENEIVALKEKPTYTHHANAGIYILHKTTLNSIPENKFFHITHLIEDQLSKGAKIIHNPIIGYWIDIGQHQDYQNAQEIIKHVNDDN